MRPSGASPASRPLLRQVPRRSAPHHVRPDHVPGRHQIEEIETLPSDLTLPVVPQPRRRPTKSGELRFFVEVVDLTNHRNVLGYDYFRPRDPSGVIGLRRDLETWFTILPSLGVSWSGRF